MFKIRSVLLIIFFFFSILSEMKERESQIKSEGRKGRNRVYGLEACTTTVKVKRGYV